MDKSAENFGAISFSGSNLACRRGGRWVFAGLNFELQAGGALTLRGANGSGKSTLLRLMAGLIRPAAGQFLWNGAIIDDEIPHAARLRFVGHQEALKPALTVAENLNFWHGLWDGGGDRESQVATALAAMDLGHLATFPARLLSAGQRHRLALARLLAAPAPLWLLDEPGNALDDSSLAALERVIADHRARGGMVVMASHGANMLENSVQLDLGAFPATVESHWSEAS